ncbi:hypothetical protein [Pseudomonas asiatica]|uniref:hypothetical protein n=1 Tax=Pseudomonas asiatica TaxID=2219225 RepID=UPI003B92A025
MATKTSKRAGETSTTVSVGIRIDPKIKFALDMMGRLQMRSLTAVIEWSIANAMSQQPLIGRNGQTTVTQAIDAIWSTDESVRFLAMCFDFPGLLTYDEMRIWDTIKASPELWITQVASEYRDHLFDEEVRKHWSDIKEHVEQHRNSPTVIPFSLIPF